MRTSTSRRSAATALAAAALLTLTGCSALLGAGEPERDEETGEITEATEAGVFSLRIGDCLDVAELGAEVESVPTVPCGEPHDAEVYAAMELPDGDYPGDDAVQASADEYCLAEFATFIGVEYDLSEIYMTTLSPQQESWDAMGDRQVLCLAEDEAGGVTGTMKAANR